MNPNLNMDWVNNPDLTENDLNGISENCGYDILMGANNGEEPRRAYQTKPWPNDQEINGIEPEKDDPQPEPEPIEAKYLTFTAGVGGASVGFIINNLSYDTPETYTKPSLQYSIDGGKTWQDYDLQISGDTADATPIELAEGASVMFKGVNDNLAYYLEDDDDWFNMQAYIDGNVAASGDVTSLLNGVGGDVALPIHCCYNMFLGCTGLTAAPSLPSTKLAEFCCKGMFNGCTGLRKAPALPATKLANYCYLEMFNDCTGLTSFPSLPATTLADGCYDGMFSGCTAITSHDVATLNTSSAVFVNNSSCASLTIRDITPPTISADTITGLPADCIIYVPAASVDAYKAAQYWSDRSAYIQAIQ